MITNKQIIDRIVPKVQRLRAEGKEVYVHWMGQDRVIQVANEEFGLLINASGSRISINANFVRHEIGMNVTLKTLERCIKVRSKTLTLADFE